MGEQNETQFIPQEVNPVMLDSDPQFNDYVRIPVPESYVDHVDAGTALTPTHLAEMAISAFSGDSNLDAGSRSIAGHVIEKASRLGGLKNIMVVRGEGRVRTLVLPKQSRADRYEECRRMAYELHDKYPGWSADNIEKIALAMATINELMALEIEYERRVANGEIPRDLDDEFDD